MTGLESLAFSKLAQEGMNKILEQNALSPAQLSAQEGKIPNIAEMNKDCMDVQNRLAEKLADFNETESFGPEGKLRQHTDGYEKTLRELAPEGQIPKVDISEWTVRTPSEVADKRLEYTLNKQELIEQWEKDNASRWPRYSEDVFDEKIGTKIRRAGDYYDGHHVRPLQLGGENTANNLVPAHAKDHYDHRGIHRPDGDLAQLTKLIKGA